MKVKKILGLVAIIIIVLVCAGAAFAFYSHKPVKVIPVVPNKAPAVSQSVTASPSVPATVSVIPKDIPSCSDVGVDSSSPIAGLTPGKSCYLDFKDGFDLVINYTGQTDAKGNPLDNWGNYTYEGKVHQLDSGMFYDISLSDGTERVTVPAITGDFNYDGVPDVESAVQVGNGENPQEDIYSFNRTTGEFDPIVSLSDTDKIDLASKKIYDSGQDTCCNAYSHALIWKNGTWVDSEDTDDLLSDSGDMTTTYDYAALSKAGLSDNGESTGPTDISLSFNKTGGSDPASADFASDFFPCDPPQYLAALYNIYTYNLQSTDTKDLMDDAFLSLSPQCSAQNSMIGTIYQDQWKQPISVDDTVYADQIQGSYFIRLLSLAPDLVLTEYNASSASVQALFQKTLGRSYLDAQGRQYLASAITNLRSRSDASSVAILGVLKRL